LITLLLEELYVSDEFYELVDPGDPPLPHQYPQLVAIALLLRHSWFPEDLADTSGWLGLPSALPNERELASSTQPSIPEAHSSQILRLRPSQSAHP